MRKADARNEKQGKSDFAELVKTTRHFFPDLVSWLNSMEDPRAKGYILYSPATLISMCIMKCLSGIVTMREMNVAFNDDAAIKNLEYLSGAELRDMPDWQTVNNFFERLPVEGVDEVRKNMISSLLRSKQFDRYRFQKHWVIILDATGIAYFKERHCEHDLVTKKIDPDTGRERLQYYHNVLEAKVVLAPKVILSIDTEFIENESEDVPKQDCELRAAERLLARLKTKYPRLPICIVADGLYATMPFMHLVRSYGWHYIFTLKGGRQKTLSEDFHLLVETAGYSRIREISYRDEKGIASYRNGMENISGKDEKCNIFEYKGDVIGKDGTVQQKKKFTWVTDFTITDENLKGLISTARGRWMIENEGFNNQKNGIYEIEHLCSRNPNAMKIHYLITQIADILMQLYLAFSDFVLAVKRPIKAVARCIGEEFWGHALTDMEKELIMKRTALRLNVST